MDQYGLDGTCSPDDCVSPELAKLYMQLTPMLLAYPPGKLATTSISAATSVSTSAIRLSSAEAEKLLIASGLSEDAAFSYARSFSGQITLRMTSSGERFIRYSNAVGDKGSFITKIAFPSPEASVNALHLKRYNNTAQFMQKVRATRPSLVLEGGVANGQNGVRQSLIISRDAFRISDGVKF